MINANNGSNRWQNFQETVAFVTCTFLSLGPSQILGIIKLAIDSSLLTINCYKKRTVNANLIKTQIDWGKFKKTQIVIQIAEKLGISQKQISQDKVKAYFESKKRRMEEKIDKLPRALLADFFALTPVLGAHLSWRIATNYKNWSCIPFISHTIQQLMGNCQNFASGFLFAARVRKADNIVSKDDFIFVNTSTKQRAIAIFHEPAYEKDENGLFEPGKWTEDSKTNPTVVLFHPNMGGAEEMSVSADFYREKGYNTLSVMIGGYEGSPGVMPSEKSMYQDIEAVKMYLVQRGVTEVAYHGFSLGTGAALQGAVGDSQTNLKTLFVTLDQPYNSAAGVGANILGPLGRGVMAAALPVGLEVELPGGLWTKTDGLNNLQKASKLKDIPLFCIERKEDAMMGRKWHNGAYTENFAKDLLAACYKTGSEQTNHLFSFQGGHGGDSLFELNFCENNIPSVRQDNTVLENQTNVWLSQQTLLSQNSYFELAKSLFSN